MIELNVGHYSKELSLCHDLELEFVLVVNEVRYVIMVAAPRVGHLL